jgi:N-acetyl-gamma-glutamyl-phosphate reductase
MSHYKAFEHQHLGEKNQSVNQLQSNYTNELIFCTQRWFCQRIFATLYTTVEESLEAVLAKYQDFIKTSLCNRYTTNINMKQVVQTNKLLLV